MSGLGVIKERLDAATPGPWHESLGANADGTSLAVTRDEKAEFLRLALNDGESPLWLIDNGSAIPAVTGDGPLAEANAILIANAPTDLARLVAALDGIEDIFGWLATIEEMYPNQLNVSAGGFIKLLRKVINDALEPRE